MRAVCHIGHHKTGTTSLQAFLSQNSHRLLQAGILYPWVESQGAAVALGKAVRGGDFAAMLPFNVREAQNALAFRMLADTLPGWKVPPYHNDLPHSRQMLLAIRNQCSTLSPDQVVLCSEVMSHFGKSAPDQIARLRNVGLELAQDFTLWCTLRRPDEQLVSWHGQQIRFGQAPKALSEPGGLNLDWLHVDYRGVVEPWLQQIPRAGVILRPYGESLDHGGSVADFQRHAEIAFPKGLLPVSALNVGFKPAVLSLLRRANKDLPGPLAKTLAHEARTLTKGLTLAATAEVEFLGEAARARLVAHFRPIHDWLSQVSGRKAFFADFEAMAECRPIPEAEALRQMLDQLTPDRIARLSDPALRDYVSGLQVQSPAS